MLLYHYSKELYRQLQTRRITEKLTDDQIQTIEAKARERSTLPYIDHISFFIEPIPLDILGVLFSKHDHPVWFDGNQLYEYTIDSESLKGNFWFEIVETPFDIQFMDSNWLDNMSDLQKREYFAKQKELKLQNGECGYGSSELEKAAIKFLGTTRRFYIDGIKHHDSASLKRYAARVPHIMLYPIGGIVAYKNPPRKVTVGKKNIVETAKMTKKW